VDFIFMLTQNDRTVAGCIDLLDSVRLTGLRHVGCKEVGASDRTLKELLKGIRAMKATSYLELVGETTEECERGARWAIELGFDRVMGGKDPKTLAELCRGKVQYYPFPGRPVGHPTTLSGTVDTIRDDCQMFASLGCPGVDLLAYRASEASPEALIATARAAFSGELVIAGSIESAERIGRIGELGADAFTVGSAIFDATIFPEEPTVEARVRRVLAAAEEESETMSEAWH
jgi:hypothetical protein